jgi:hypothetical protein
MDEDLWSNVNEYFTQAVKAEKDKAFNAAVVLYFKTIASLVDLFIYRKELIKLSNHTERFRLLRNKYREIYSLIDKDFSVYQESYKSRLSKEHVEVMKNDLRKLEELTKIRIAAQE